MTNFEEVMDDIMSYVEKDTSKKVWESDADLRAYIKEWDGEHRRTITDHLLNGLERTSAWQRHVEERPEEPPPKKITRARPRKTPLPGARGYVIKGGQRSYKVDRRGAWHDVKTGRYIKRA